VIQIRTPENSEERNPPMLNIKRCFSNNRLTKALTGVTKREFDKLLKTFKKELKEQALNKKKQRQREIGGGRKHTLKGTKEKLFFILFYIKTYPTFDMMGFIFEVDKAQPCRWIQQYLPILEATLGREVVLPVRQISSVEEFIQLFPPQVKEVFVDGTERPIQRSKDNEKQKANYSGKKKRHTRKNIIMTDKSKKIYLLTKTEEGKKHDKTAANEAEVFHHIGENVQCLVDLGFLGVQKEFPKLKLIIPKKKPKGKQLSNEDKEANREKARVRVKVEHAISGIKRLRSVSDILRNRKKNFDDKFMLIASGLWNFHLEMVA